MNEARLASIGVIGMRITSHQGHASTWVLGANHARDMHGGNVSLLGVEFVRTIETVKC